MDYKGVKCPNCGDSFSVSSDGSLDPIGKAEEIYMEPLPKTTKFCPKDGAKLVENNIPEPV